MVDKPERTTASATSAGPLVTAAIFVVVILALYVGAGIFVPLVLAVLLAFALAPLVNQLRRFHVPHIGAVIIAVGLAAIVLATIGYVVATQLVKLAADLPSYQATVSTKLKAFQTSMGGSNFVERLGSAVDQLKAQLAPASPSTLSGPNSIPVPVTIANTPDNPLGVVQSILGSVLGPLATAAIVVVFLVFLLLERADLRDRFLKLVSRGDLRTSTKVMDDAAARVGRYLLVQFGVNLAYGVILGGGLTLIGVPNGILWGLLATLFRYIPFVGTLIVAIIPFTLAFAVDPGWSMLVKSVALFVVLETTATNVVEPRLYGSSTGLSALAVLVAAMFWATLWGPIGLILATPLTVCLVVLGRYVPQLQFLEVMLGSEPVLNPAERLYQRLVAGNAGEAIDIAEQYENGDKRRQFYEDVALPALRFAEADLSVDPADLIQRRRVVESLDEVIDELEADVEVDEGTARVIVIGGRTELDGAAARIVASLMQGAGIRARVMPPVSVRREALRQLDTTGIDTVCLVYLGEHARSYARSVARQLKRQHPNLRLVVAMLGIAATSLAEMESSVNADAVVTTSGEAVQSVTSIGELPESNPVTTGSSDPDDVELGRLREAIRNDLMVADFLRSVAEHFNVAVAIANSAGGEETRTASREATLSGDELHGSRRLIERVIQSRELLVIADASKDKDFADDAFLLESGVRFYAGAPLISSDGRTLGVLAIMDESPRTIAPSEREKLLSLASDFMDIPRVRQAATVAST